MSLATDPETGESRAREVVATLPHTDQLLTLRTSSGVIVTIEDHPILERYRDEGGRVRHHRGPPATGIRRIGCGRSPRTSTCDFSNELLS